MQDNNVYKTVIDRFAIYICQLAGRQCLHSKLNHT